jgi:hypothetical protein
MWKRLILALMGRLHSVAHVLPKRSHDAPGLETLNNFETGRDPEAQLALMLEAVALLDVADAGVIRARLSGNAGATPLADDAIDRRDSAPHYGLAVIRLSERLAWVAAQESSGVAPTQRRAMGLVKFQRVPAQEVADLLRLPTEVVEHWIHEGGL